MVSNSPEFPACFQTGATLVTEVCGSYEIAWKLWTLVGEPVGDFSLRWELTDVRIVTDKLMRPPRSSVARLPPALAAAARKTALYVKGNALLRTGAGVPPQALALAFDTGVSVRTGGGGSLNVPGSPSWDKFLINDGRSRGRCAVRDSDYVPATTAKAVMRAGVLDLYNLEICSGSTVDVSDLEAALTDYCATQAAERAFGYCARPNKKPKPGTSQTQALDQAFDRLDASRNGLAKEPLRQSLPTDPFAAMRPQADRLAAPAGLDMGAALEAAEARRVVNQAARLERERQAAALARQRETATVDCAALQASQNLCLQNHCPTEPPAQVCSSYIERDTCRPSTAPLPSPGSSRNASICLGIISECVAQAPNPAHLSWKQCRAGSNPNPCFPSGQRIDSVEACVDARMSR